MVVVAVVFGKEGRQTRRPSPWQPGRPLKFSRRARTPPARASQPSKIRRPVSGEVHLSQQLQFATALALEAPTFRPCRPIAGCSHTSAGDCVAHRCPRGPSRGTLEISSPAILLPTTRTHARTPRNGHGRRETGENFSPGLDLLARQSGAQPQASR